MAGVGGSRERDHGHGGAAADVTSRVLVVEDDPDIQDFFAFLLAAEDLELVPVFDGQRALDLLTESREPFDLILLDLMLPRLTGEEFFAALNEQGPSKVPVILCSVDEERAEQVRRQGAVAGIYVKGDPGERLIALINEILGRG